MGFKEAGNQETGLSEVFSSWKGDQRISSSSRVAAKSSKGDPTEATVKALRAKSPDHDVSERAFDTGRREKHVGIEVGKLNATA